MYNAKRRRQGKEKGEGDERHHPGMGTGYGKPVPVTMRPVPKDPQPVRNSSFPRA